MLLLLHAPGFPGADKLYYSHDTNGYCIDKNGQLWGWGFNGYGQLGAGNTVALLAIRVRRRNFTVVVSVMETLR